MAKVSLCKQLVSCVITLGFIGAGTYIATRATTKAMYDAEDARFERNRRKILAMCEKDKKRIEREKRERKLEIEKQKKIPINVIMEQVKIEGHQIRAEKELEECENELLDIIERHHPEA